MVVMAAGIGSRFGGGIKQLEPVGPGGEIIMDYSIHDAKEAGFDKVVFVIRKDLEKDFKEVIGNRIEQYIEVAYVYQEVDDIPAGYQERFAARTKPWGTGQAILCCKDVVDAPFLVINADDYYGKQAFKEAYAYLTTDRAASYGCAAECDCGGKAADGLASGNDEICMISFVLKNTLSEHGAVTRGVCKVNESGYLTEIAETRNIEKCGVEAIVKTASGETPIDVESPVSMNMFGLYPKFFDILESRFDTFLAGIEENDLKAEYLLPTIIGELLDEKQLAVKVLESQDKWFGVTYQEDKEAVVAAVRGLVDKGVYPENVFR